MNNNAFFSWDYFQLTTNSAIYMLQKLEPLIISEVN